MTCFPASEIYRLRIPAAPGSAVTRKEHNDTPVQSQSERDKTVANDEGGSDRPSVGVKRPWCRLAPDRLAGYIPKLHLITAQNQEEMQLWNELSDAAIFLWLI